MAIKNKKVKVNLKESLKAKLKAKVGDLIELPFHIIGKIVSYDEEKEGFRAIPLYAEDKTLRLINIGIKEESFELSNFPKAFVRNPKIKRLTEEELANSVDLPRGETEKVLFVQYTDGEDRVVGKWTVSYVEPIFDTVVRLNGRDESEVSGYRVCQMVQDRYYYRQGENGDILQVTHYPVDEEPEQELVFPNGSVISEELYSQVQKEFEKMAPFVINGNIL